MFCRAVYLAKSGLFSRASCETQKLWGYRVIHHGWTYSSKLNFSAFELKAFYIFRLSLHQSHWKKPNRHGFCQKCLFPFSSLWCFSMLLEENRGSLFMREKKVSWEDWNGAFFHVFSKCLTPASHCGLEAGIVLWPRIVPSALNNNNNKINQDHVKSIIMDDFSMNLTSLDHGCLLFLLPK